MTILITGAAGCTGRHLAAALPDAVRSTRADCDLADPAAVGALVAAVRPARIYHLAGAFTNRPDDDHRANVVAAENLLAAAAGCRVLLVGSAAEYGAVSGCVAEDQPLRPTSAYGRSKARQTEVMRAYADRVDVVMVRPFNLLADGLAPALLLGRVQAWLATRRGPLVLGDLGARRDYLPIADALADYQLVMARGRRGEVYHVGSGRPRLVREVVHELLAAHGVGPQVIEERAGASGVGGGGDAWADVRKIAALREEGEHDRERREPEALDGLEEGL